MAGIRAGVVLAVLVWVAVAPASGSSALDLVVLGDEPGSARVRACIPLEAGEPFFLEFINSIYRAPVKETLVYIAGEGFFVITVESPSQGVFEYYGLETDGTGRADLNRRIGEIRIRSHSYEHHRLTVGARSIGFKSIARGGEPLSIDVRAGDGSCRP